ncbi:MAG: DUF1569 domain-containing protein [Planctomycetaceae bacterium]|nr:DUF1569 domain-containing protein [Planctomycetaceae bacterium]
MNVPLEAKDENKQVEPEGNERRPVEYTSISAVLSDAEFLTVHPHRTVGSWSYGKILQHLADSYNRSIDGFGYKNAFIIRIIAGNFMKKKFLREKMPAGFKLPKAQEEKLPSQETSIEESLANLKQAIARFECEEARADHPAFGKLTSEEWIQLHLRHSELHMSFVKPA